MSFFHDGFGGGSLSFFNLHVIIHLYTKFHVGIKNFPIFKGFPPQVGMDYKEKYSGSKNGNVNQSWFRLKCFLFWLRNVLQSKGFPYLQLRVYSSAIPREPWRIWWKVSLKYFPNLLFWSLVDSHEYDSADCRLYLDYKEHKHCQVNINFS